MPVHEILEKKGERLVTIAPDRPISEAVALLEQENIGALLVTSSDGKLTGILSERDIIRGLAQGGAKVLDQSVSDLMTSGVVTCEPDTENESLMEKMRAQRIRHLPVLRDGSLLGIISISDVIEAVVDELKWMRSTLRDQVARSVAWSTEED